MTTLYFAILAHFVGDYLLQSDWMAREKTHAILPALAHALTYTVPFLLLTRSIPALLFIGGTHFLIDRFRLARYVCWAKNWLAPWPVCHSGNLCGAKTEHEPHRVPPTKPWRDCAATGYDPDRPLWLTLWLLIITDNTLHVICNTIALTW